MMFRTLNLYLVVLFLVASTAWGKLNDPTHAFRHLQFFDDGVLDDIPNGLEAGATENHQLWQCEGDVSALRITIFKLLLNQTNS